jgi:hypothetical protein
MVEAIKPTDVATTKADIMPDAVMTAWNNVIAKNFSNGSSRVGQEEIIALLQPLTPEGQRQQVFASKWLDIEDIYRAQGWSVVYDKPAYCESYEATTTFKAKK